MDSVYGTEGSGFESLRVYWSGVWACPEWAPVGIALQLKRVPTHLYTGSVATAGQREPQANEGRLRRGVGLGGAFFLWRARRMGRKVTLLFTDDGRLVESDESDFDDGVAKPQAGKHQHISVGLLEFLMRKAMFDLKKGRWILRRFDWSRILEVLCFVLKEERAKAIVTTPRQYAIFLLQNEEPIRNAEEVMAETLDWFADRRDSQSWRAYRAARTAGGNVKAALLAMHHAASPAAGESSERSAGHAPAQ